MAPISVNIKHSGKSYTLNLDPDLPAKAFKEEVYQATGIPVDRMKVMVKGGVLKDDTPWQKINPKAGQTFMVIGAAGELPKPPEKPVVFLEDMDDTELAEALAKPVGLRNLGNTCYMNATLQAMRAIPELQTALGVEKPSATEPPATEAQPDIPGAMPDLVPTPINPPAADAPAPAPANAPANAPPVLAALPSALGSLYSRMLRTSDTVAPVAFLNLLREVNPQFAERDRAHSHGMSALMGGGYAQQDADECLTTIVTALGSVPGQSETNKKFVEQYMTGEMTRVLKCNDADEAPSTSTENVLKITCNIDATVNYMASGIQKSLSQLVLKRSPTLGRDANYTQESRMTRLPAYLFVHMARFSWRADINKKAKIMRKVKFPTEYDAVDLCSDELKAKLLPVSRRLKAVEKEREERRKVRRRTKIAVPAPASTSAAPAAGADVEMADAAAAPAVAAASTSAMEVEGEGADKGKAAEEGGALEDESAYRARELAELEALVDQGTKADVGCSVSGLYELVAIVTHKGAAADAGHYIGFVKKSVFHPPKLGEEQESDEDWYKFDDDKVSLFPKEKLTSLDGGGEDSAAYVLLYKTKPLA
ncbi:hypothetical protein B0H17DRAFT_1049578 [Mycena rosella]|uniref:Ubiquitin carboxyl-terminal hydrolase n=1 Tax=Mycena rosella TaxID=1033263 RepID=A0AAD7GKT7_MYCRO|nr:hypothetical protein B0H17DRAFT_1049578 [Mycena rosella]